MTATEKESFSAENETPVEYSHSNQDDSHNVKDSYATQDASLIVSNPDSVDDFFRSGSSPKYNDQEEQFSKNDLVDYYVDVVSSDVVPINPITLNSEELHENVENGSEDLHQSILNPKILHHTVQSSSNMNDSVNQYAFVQVEEYPQMRLEHDKSMSNLCSDIEKIKNSLVYLSNGFDGIKKDMKSLMEVLYKPIAGGISGINLFPFPIKSIQELKEFDKKLGDNEEFFNQIVS